MADVARSSAAVIIPAVFFIPYLLDYGVYRCQVPHPPGYLLSPEWTPYLLQTGHSAFSRLDRLP
jgi:hypothetical protein